MNPFDHEYHGNHQMLSALMLLNRACIPGTITIDQTLIQSLRFGASDRPVSLTNGKGIAVFFRVAVLEALLSDGIGDGYPLLRLSIRHVMFMFLCIIHVPRQI
jgi:hypothetical protein